MRIKWNAMAANSRTRIERHEAERLGGSCANHFPRIDIQRITKPRHFVGHPDVYRAKSVFEQLGGFRDARRAHRIDVADYLRIEISGCHGGIIRDAAYNFWDVVGLKLRI